ncbi:hypothetical protein FBEOM_11346 [Fusarium beomiforme]|uniref:Uncharacterized protein n=1 Tax=Fusarium beomiforme TaxID=44412 RepID=A0A9P5A9K6_9HYPO|nr:hypothetical protein FBEOM_11346 [Fusarium beomiforme]
MSSSIAIPAGPSATPSRHNGTGSSANSPYLTSPSCSSPSAGKDKALHAHRPCLLSWLKPDPPPTRRDCTHRSFVPALLTLSQAPLSPSKNAPSLTSANRTALLGCQGFAWNPEIFLPSYNDCDYVPLENRLDPVDDIFPTDEESKKMLPQLP